MLDNKNKDTKNLTQFMSQYKMILQFQQNTTIYGSQLDYVWRNFGNSQCLLGTIEAYWSNHKPIYFAYDLPYHVTNFTFHKLTKPFSKKISFTNYGQYYAN
jgi:hypothetical protein